MGREEMYNVHATCRCSMACPAQVKTKVPNTVLCTMRNCEPLAPNPNHGSVLHLCNLEHACMGCFLPLDLHETRITRFTAIYIHIYIHRHTHTYTYTVLYIYTALSTAGDSTRDNSSGCVLHNLAHLQSLRHSAYRTGSLSSLHKHLTVRSQRILEHSSLET